MKRKGKRVYLYGYILFFLLTATIVTVAVFATDFIAERLGENRLAISGLMLLVILLISLLITGLYYFCRRKATEKHVRQILYATERIAAGEFSVRIPIEKTYEDYDEYDLIKQNINDMAVELSKAEMMKSDFISNVSHELKTPLSVIRSYASALKDQDLSESERREYIETVISASDKLAALVTNILKLNKLEKGGLPPEYERCNLAALAADCVLGLENKAEEKGVEFDCDLEEITLFVPVSYVEIIFNNLLSNAVKFTERGGHVRVQLRSEGGRAVFSVKDDGCGISKETGAHIFERFYQGDTSHAAEGNGLGLALVRQAIDAMGGSIYVESEPGKGAFFKVEILGETNHG